MYNLIFQYDFNQKLSEFLNDYKGNKIFVLTDSNTKKYCLPIIKDSLPNNYVSITVPFGENSKKIDYVNYIWNELTQSSADRKSLLINLGGGMITDIGGFVAGTFQRGIDYINIPTTLLAQIDASVGGKTGVNFNNLKNQIGLFYNSKAVFISSIFFYTLPKRELISGLAEMVKHSLLENQESWENIKSINPDRIDIKELSSLVKKSVEIKLKIVETDPFEKGSREALNFGHTIGHAVETYLNKRNISILHGEAVAIGMIAELFLSNKVLSFNFQKLFEVSEYLATYFKSFKINYNDYEELFEIMKHDKKNKKNTIRFSLLKDFGDFKINQQCSKEDIFEALNFYFQIQK